MDQHNQNKALIAPLRAALYDFEPAHLKSVMAEVFAPDAAVHLAHPFETLSGWEELYERGFLDLARAFPDLERRDTIVMAGSTEQGRDWVGCCGYYTGTFMADWLDIPFTGHQTSLRFHEFYRVEGGRVVEFQALWDIPEVMMQARAWPLSPSLGREWHVPGPAPQNGFVPGPYDTDQAAASYKLVLDMIEGLGKFAEGGAEAMGLENYWHPKFSWYGPSGIGTGRGIRGFRHWHQIPFLNAMPDRRSSLSDGHMFADGDFVGFTAWPGMEMTISADGFLGIAPSGQEITMRSLDFWRCENGLIRENWVLVDILHVYDQIGVDVLGRMREFNKARQL